jgi:predicted ATPase/DNA-binding SARP family transcriptional activator
MPHLALYLLGSFLALIDGEPLMGLESKKVRALLAYLAVESDRLHSRDQLCALLWPDQPDPVAHTNLRQSLANLRQALGDRSTSRPFLLISHEMIQFNLLSDSWLDVAAFTALVAACDKHRHRKLATCRSCLDRLQQAADLYRGDFLAQFSFGAGAAFEEWALLKREQLHRMALRVFERLADHSLWRGAYETAYQYAVRQLELEPWREEAHRQAMRALALDGQRSAALAQYQRCQRILAAELRVEPSAETRALYEQIKTNRLTAPAALHALPTIATPLIGRERELAEIDRLVADPACRLVTIVGPGGVGKTRLVLQAAAAQAGAFASGVHFVPLATVTTRALFTTTLAHTLGLVLNSASEPLLQLAHYLAQREILIVLDNFEQLLSEGVEALAYLISQASQAVFLVTSCERLKLYEEHVLVLPGLGLPDLDGDRTPEALAQAEAVQLLVDAAQRAGHDFQPQAADWVPLAEVCHFLMGMPLALEFVAAWLDTLSAGDILLELRRDPGLLRIGRQNAPVRQRTLSHIFDYAWQRLSEEERLVLGTFTVFQGGFTRSAALHVAAVAIGAALPASLLADLVHKSLLIYDRVRDRYAFHELVQHFVATQLSGDESQARKTRQAHCAYYCSFLQARQATFRSVQQQAVLAETDADLENIRLAWSWAVAQQDGRSIAAALDGLFALYDIRSRFLEGEAAFRAAALSLAIGPADAEQQMTVARLETRQGWFAFHLGHPEESIGLLQHSLACLRQYHAEREIAFSLHYLGAVLRHLGHYEQAGDYLVEALQLAQNSRDRYLISICLNTLGQVAWLRGDYDLARRYCEEGLQLKREIGDQRGTMYPLIYLGRVAEARGEYDRAQHLFEESMNVSILAGDRRGTAAAWQNMGDVAFAQRRYAEAGQSFQHSLTISRDIGDRLGASFSLIRLGKVNVACGEMQIGGVHLREGLQVALEIGSQPALFDGLLGMTELWLTANQPNRARECLNSVERSPQLSFVQCQHAQRLRAELETTIACAPESEPEIPNHMDLEMFVKENVLMPALL